MKRWLVWGLFVTLWTVLLEIPMPADEHLPAGHLISGNRYFAKSIHVTMYAVLAILSAHVPLAARYRVGLMFFLMAHATVTELLQEMMAAHSHRGGSLHDVGFDHLGIAIGTLLSWKGWTRSDGQV